VILWLLVGLALAGGKDEKACRKARDGGTAAHWEVYLQAHPDGVCASEARAKTEPPPPPPVEPVEAQPIAAIVEVVWSNVAIEVGPLSADVATAGLDTAVPALRECGLAELAKNPQIGAMTDAVTVLVDQEGKVTEVAWRNGGWPEAVRACASEAVKSATFSLGLGTTTVGATLTLAPR
jgi:hypothetical protein